MKKKKLLNISLVVLIILMLLIVNITENINIIGMIIFNIILYAIFILLMGFKYKDFKNIIISHEFIFETIYLAYTIPASICFLIDGGIARISTFAITQSSILSTLVLYFNINAILIMLLSISKEGIRNFYDIKNNDVIDYDIKRINVFDIFALIATLYFVWQNIKNGLMFSNISYYTKRSLLSLGNMYDYLAIFMSAYLYAYIYMMTRSNKKISLLSSKSIYVLIVSIPFWVCALFTGRRYFVFLIILITLTLFSSIKKIKIKYIIALSIMIIIMLFASFSRMHLKKYNIKDVFYYSFGEFINVNYVTNYYINNTYNLKYGKTYTIDVITSVLPKKLYPKKSQQLSTEFMHTVNSNYGLAFNPIAEGLVNFGNKCVYILLPLVLFFYIKLAYIIGKKYNFIYFIFVAENINFMRGQFSNSIFLIAFIGIVVGLIINSSIVSKYTSKKRQ